MEITMSVRRRGRLGSLGTAALTLLTFVAVAAQPTLAQTRTLAILADVPALMLAPYHPQTITVLYSSPLYDSHPYYGVNQSGGARYWH
jgi:hypothetical protein